MAGILERIGATTTGMQLLLLAFLLSGQLLALAFGIPEISEALTATTLIFAAMTFVGTGLVYLALLPLETGGTASGG